MHSDSDYFQKQTLFETIECGQGILVALRWNEKRWIVIDSEGSGHYP